MKKRKIYGPSHGRNRRPASRRLSAIFALFILLPGNLPLSAEEVAGVLIDQLRQEYDGGPKLPVVSTTPPGLATEIKIFPRSQSEVVFQTTPELFLPSYQSYGINGQVDKALGDVVNLGGSNRKLESIEVTMVNWAKASSWPDLAAANPEGYHHPLTVFVYLVAESNLFLLTEKSQETLIPWRPATLDDGGGYPFGGFAFKTRFDFNEGFPLSRQIVVLVSYNTQSSGFQPIGSPGPYNELNVGLAGEAPLVGSDDDPTRMIRFVEGLSKSRAFGTLAPIFTVRTFSAEPSQGIPQDAGGYLVEAKVIEEGYTGEASANFEVTPLPAQVSFVNKKQAADGTPKPISAVTDPPGLPVDIVYAKRNGPPVERGASPVFVTLKPGNYFGKVSGMMTLGYSYDLWIADKVAGGGVPADQADRDDDPDLDGGTNFEEYLSGSNPGSAGDALDSLMGLTQAGARILVSFSRNNEAADIAYFLQATDDLSDPDQWMDLPLPEGLTNPLPAVERVRVPLEISPGSGSRFFRVKYQITTPGD